MNHYSPKERFMANTEVANSHRSLCHAPFFIMALDAALLRYQEQLTISTGPDPVTAAANHHKLVGAREFVTVLLNLAEKIDLPQQPKPSSLNYRT